METKILSGKEVAQSITEALILKRESLEASGKKPMLAIVRVGENPSDLAYERGACARAEKIGVVVKKHLLNENAATGDVLAEIEKLNADKNVDGILVFRPLPKHIDDDAVRNAIAKEKDVDGIGDLAMAGVYAGKQIGFPPCTAEACIEILKHYNVDLAGAKVTVIGRSLVIGKPAAMMLIKENATVTICHTKTKNLSDVAKNADIIIAAAGHAKTVTADFIKEGQTIIDVGINFDENDRMIGDVDFDSAMQKNIAITPVPGGVGAVTSSILMKHVIEAAEREI